MKYISINDKVITKMSKAAQEAGKLILDHRMDFEVESKTEEEIVTAADVGANKLIVKMLKDNFENYGYSSEEGGEEGNQCDRRFIIDSLDGTTRKVWGGSGYTVSIAEEVEGNVRSAVVYDPEHKEMYTAIHGLGAYRNGERIKVSNLTDLSLSFVSCDWGNKDKFREEGFSYYYKLMMPKMAARRIVPQFAPANDLARIAEGRIHALVCNDTWMADHAAGALILKEAGGYITNFYMRDKFDHKVAGIVAACNKSVWDKLTGLIFNRK